MSGMNPSGRASSSVIVAVAVVVVVFGLYLLSVPHVWKCSLQPSLPDAGVLVNPPWARAYVAPYFRLYETPLRRPLEVYFNWSNDFEFDPPQVPQNWRR